MTTQVLILNLNRIGDLIQTVPLLDRLREECPDSAIDLVVNRPCAPMAALLPGVRQVFADDVHTQLGHISEGADHRALAQEVAGWPEPWKAVGYDRVINLTFTRRSGWLAAALGVADTRGVVMTPAGTSVVRNPWFTYSADLLQYRRVNRFNLVDLFALGGSGHGPYTPIHISIPPSAEHWARAEFPNNEGGLLRIAVQVGASQAGKAWRPDLFGRTMAAMSRRMRVEFVLTGTVGDTDSGQRAMAAYRAVGGTGTIHHAIGRTDIAQLAALLQQCNLLITNDTGTMHVAAGVGVPVLNLSVGPVSFWETGPYGPGHWVVQPDGSGATQSGPDQILPDQVAALAVHQLGRAPFPAIWTGVRVYESGVDADGLQNYQQRAGRYDANADWYGRFLRKFWYEELTQRPSRLVVDESYPDLIDQQDRFTEIASLGDCLLTQATYLVRLTQQSRPPDLQAATAELATLHWYLVSLAKMSPIFHVLTVALNRDLQNGHTRTVADLARQHQSAYQTFRSRVHGVMTRLVEGARTSRTRGKDWSSVFGHDAQGPAPTPPSRLVDVWPPTVKSVPWIYSRCNAVIPEVKGAR